MLIHNANVTGSMHLNGMDMSTITGSISSTTFNQYTSSTNEFTGSANTRLNSLDSASGSFSTRVTSLESFSSSLDATFATDAQLSGVSESLAGRLTTDESNISSLQTASGSFSTRITDIEADYATTGSNTFTGTQNITNTTNATGFDSTAALYTDGGLRVSKDTYVSGTMYVNNLTVYGSASVEYVTSSILVGLEYIDLNTDLPALRYAGMRVSDSGSVATYITSSLLWDSETNKWIYSNPAGSTYSGGMLISGPRASALGEEQGTTFNALIKGQGGDHITSSLITDTGTALRVPYTVEVTGSVNATSLTGSLDGSNIINSSIQNTKLANSSVTVTAGSGLSGGGSVSLGSSITLTNTAPDQTVTLTNGGNITVTGTYPNFTLTNGITNNNQLVNGAGYITGINSSDVTTALGYTPYNATNPNGYISAISSSMVTTALGYTPVTNARTLTINGVTYDLTADRSWTISTTSGVTSFNTRTGAITLTSGDVTTALGYTPVTEGRTLTINGVTYDLSANRSWSITAGVSSVTAGTGISTSTLSGTVTVTNTGLLSGTAGTGISVSTVNQNLTITNTGLLSGTAGTGISVSTVNQNLTITNTGLLGATAGTGISVSTVNQNVTITNTGLLGTTAGTGISISTVNQNSTITNTGVTSLTAGSGISLSGATGGITVTNTITNNNQLTNGAGYITSAALSSYLPLSGGTMSGNIVVNSPSNYWSSTITGLTNAPLIAPSVNVGTSALYVPLTHMSAQYNSGYRTHVSTGIYKAASGWSAGWYMAIGGSDTNPTEAFFLNYGGSISHTYGYVNIDGSARSPIFYDSNDTTYYIDGNGTSRLSNLWIRGAGQYDGYLYVGGTNAGDRLNINFDQVWTTTGNLHFQYSSAGNIDMNQGGGYTFSRTSLRAPIFYDYDNTAYYLNPAGQNIVNQLTLGSTTGTDVTLGVNGAAHITGANYLYFGGSIGAVGGWGTREYNSGGIKYLNSNGFYFDNTGYGSTWAFSSNGNSGNITATVDFRAPIFYDSNNTSYYGDFASTSRIRSLNMGYIGGQVYQNSDGGTLFFNANGESDIQGYSIGTTMENYGGNYTKLTIDWHTGIRIGAASGYGGIRFYNNSVKYYGGSQVFSVAEGDNHVRVNNVLFVSGDARAPIFYDQNNTGYYLDLNSTTSIRTVGSWRSDSSSWDGEFSGKMQYHSNHWYIQAADLLIYRNSGGSNVFTVNQSGVAIATGDMRAPVFYDQNDTGYYMDFNSTTSGVLRGNLIFNDYGAGVVGTYVSTRYQGVFSMGNAYKLPIDGNGTGTLYGIAWSHPNAGGAAGNLGSHGMLILENGGFQGAWGGGSLRTPGSVYGTIFYDWNNTGYYLDPASTSVVNVLQFGTSTNSGRFDGESTWGVRFRTSDGYIWFGPANSGHAHIYTDRSNFYFNTQLTVNDGSQINTSDIRANIFYDKQDTGYYVDPNGTSNLLKFSEFTMAYNGMNPMSANSPYAARYAGSALYRNGTMGNGNTDFNVMFSNWGSGFIDSWSSPANAPGGSTHYVGLQGFHYNFVNNSQAYGFQMACAGEADNRFFWRSAWPNLRSWVEMIHSGNISSQTVSNSDMVDGYHVAVGGNANTIPTRNGSGYLIPENWIQLNGIYGLYSPTNNAHLRPNNASYGSWLMTGSRNGWQGIEFDSGGAGNITMMVATDSNTVGFHNNSYGWQIRWANGTLYCGKNSYGGNEATVMDSSNIASYTAGNVNSISSAVGGAYQWTGIQSFFTNRGGYVGSTDSARLEAFATGGNAAFMSFHRSGNYAVNFGLDADNVLRIGGWSASANRWQLDMSGNMTVAGDVTAYSDARVKTNVNTIENALEKTLALRGVTYNRTDSEDIRTKVGVIAQEIIEVLPEVVNQDNDGMYNVSYGNITALLIEAIKEQQSQIEELKTIINGLTK